MVIKHKTTSARVGYAARSMYAKSGRKTEGIPTNSPTKYKHIYMY